MIRNWLSPRQAAQRPYRYRTLYVLLGLCCLMLAACNNTTPTPPAATATGVSNVVISTSTTETAPSDTPVATTDDPIIPTPAPPAEVPVYGGIVRPQVVEWYAAKQINPLAVMLSNTMNRSLLDPLTGESDLAASWEVSGTRATFKLQPDAAWSDGTPIRGIDVADVLIQAIALGELSGVRNATAEGDTVTLTLQEASCPAVMNAASVPIVDVREFPPVRTSNGVTVEELDATHWEFRSANSAWQYHYYEDENDLREAWAAGELTGVIGASRLKLGVFADTERTTENGATIAALIFRLGDTTVQSQAVREALTLSLERDALYSEAYGGTVPALPSALLHPDHWASPAFDLPADPDAAADALEAAGWRDRNGDGIREDAQNTPLAITLMAPLSLDEQWEAVARATVAQWRTIGVDAQVQFVEEYPLQERLHDGRWQVALLAYWLAPDPDQRPLLAPSPLTDMVGQDLNVTGYNNPAVTALLNEAAAVTGCDLTERAILYEQAWERILADQTIYPLFPLPLDSIVQ